MDYRAEASPIIQEFLSYHETIRGHSGKTVDEYFFDLRTFFRYIKQLKGRAPDEMPFNEISIKDVDLQLIQSVSLSDIYDFMSFLSRDRARQGNSTHTGYGLGAAARARKVASIRSFYRYLTHKAHLLSENPVEELDSPKLRKTLPHYLSLDESIRLLESVKGRHQRRDYCMITLFLNCGLRISELAGLNLTDVREDALRVIGKGNKERIVFLNEACMEAIEDYLIERNNVQNKEQALFLSARRTRISVQTVHVTVKKHLAAAGLDTSVYSTHKLRHTAATLMLQNGVDVRTLQEVLGHDHLNTTQIYTHIGGSELREAARANPLGRVRSGAPSKQHKD